MRGDHVPSAGLAEGQLWAELTGRPATAKAVAKGMEEPARALVVSELPDLLLNDADTWTKDLGHVAVGWLIPSVDLRSAAQKTGFALSLTRWHGIDGSISSSA